jgi:hypothetical protein
VNTTGLAAGTYTGTITVIAPGAGDSPQSIPIDLNLIPLNEAGILTVAILVNTTNPQGYNSNPLSPGEFQRYPERYLEHLQVPYEIIDVATTPPLLDLSRRHLIIAGHKGLNPTSAWQNAIINAVNNGAGFVNLDWDSQIGLQSHIQTIFGAVGSSVGTPATAVIVPSSVMSDGATPHYIAALQRRFLETPSGDLVYGFHDDENSVLQPVRSTVLTGASGTVIARTGGNPLIFVTSFGAGRAVHVGTLEYLKADRSGFLRGLDDLFWRSLVWAAKKPFVLRGYPRLWAVQMDDSHSGWAFRVRDLYDSALTGNVNADGTGGPWKVTGYVYTSPSLSLGSAERASAISDINAGLLQISPHNFVDGQQCGDMYWNGFTGPLTDEQWLNNITNVLAWQEGAGGADRIPEFSRSMIPHCWDLSDNTGFDLWNALGFRYVTSIQKPGYQISFNDDVNKYGGQERPSARPFWVYEKPPKKTRNENQPFFFADDYPVNSRTGVPAQNLFLFATQVQGVGDPRSDLAWPSTSIPWTVDQSIDQFQRHTWRFWSSLAPMQIFTHDASNYALASVADRRTVIQQVSSWLNGEKVKHVFMEEMGDYVYARSKSVLLDALLSDDNITLTFSGNAATADGVLINTEVMLFLADDEGTSLTVPGFTGGTSVSLPVTVP